MQFPTISSMLMVLAATSSATALPSTTELQERQSNKGVWRAVGASTYNGFLGAGFIFPIAAETNYIDGAPGFIAQCSSASYLGSNLFSDCWGYIDGRNASLHAAVNWGRPNQLTFDTVTLRHAFQNAQGKNVVATGTWAVDTTRISDIRQFSVSVTNVTNAN